MKLTDLKRGMKCTTRNADEFIVRKVGKIDISFIADSRHGYKGIGLMKQNLTNQFRESDIIKVEDITLDGYKVIWERAEDKYYLRLPNADDVHSTYLNYDAGNELFGFMGKLPTEKWQTQFTQEEIDKLPYRDFIQSLIKELVE